MNDRMKENMEKKAKELHDCCTNYLYEHQTDVIKDRFRIIAKHVLAQELRARIEAIQQTTNLFVFQQSNAGYVNTAKQRVKELQEELSHMEGWENE